MSNNIRFLSPHCIFRIPGHISMSGGNGVYRNKEFLQEEGSRKGYQDEYVKRISYLAKCAVAEFDFPDDDGPIGIAITVHIPPLKRVKNGKPLKRDELKALQDLVPNRSPSVWSIQKMFAKALKGIFYKEERQIAVFDFIKIHDKEEFIDVVVFKPTSVRELLHDVRNI